MKDFFSPPFDSIGLDIGNFSVKLAQIKKKPFSSDRLLSFSTAAVKSDKPQDVIEAIKKAFSDLGADSNKVNLSVCGPKIIMRYIILPSMKKTDLAQSLELELERYIPYKREDVTIDYRVLSNLPNSQMLIMLVAAERRFIEERASIARNAGLDPQLINVDTLALTDAFKAALPKLKGVAAILDIGYKMNKLVVMENDIPYFSRDIEVGERDIIQMIAERLQLDTDAAKALGYEPKDKAKEVADAIKPNLTNLIDELSLSFEYCERNLEKKVESLYLTGGGTRIKVLADSLERIPNLKISTWDPTQGFKISSSVSIEQVGQYSSVLAVAIGLALSGIPAA